MGPPVESSEGLLLGIAREIHVAILALVDSSSSWYCVPFFLTSYLILRRYPMVIDRLKQAVMDRLGRASVTFTHSASPLNLRTKDGSLTDLVKLCEQSTPPCHLNPFLFNGHLQTAWTTVKPHGPPIHYRRRIFDAEHKCYLGTFAVDFAVDPHDEHDDSLPPRTAYFSEQAFANISSDDERPMLIVLHGLSGGSHEVYLRHAIEPLLGKDAGNWDVCVVNSRGCAKSEITSSVLFNARATWDVRQVIKWAKKTFPNRPLFALGFSLGANILTNYVGEEGEDCPLKAAVVVGNPFALHLVSRGLQRTFIGLEVYSRVMGGSMVEFVRRNKEAVQKYTNLDYEKIMTVKYLGDFDREVQTVAWGYPTEEAYYRDASSSDSVLAIRIPFFAINAADDPIAMNEAVPYLEFKQNPYTVVCTTSLGGHLSWFELGGGRWHARPISNFFRNMATKIDLSNLKATEQQLTSGNRHSGVVDFDPMKRKMNIHLD